jgi:hypothetical protein
VPSGFARTRSDALRAPQPYWNRERLKGCIMDSKIKWLGIVGVCAALSATPRVAEATSINNTKVYSITIVGGNTGFVRLSITGSVSAGRPACHVPGLWTNYAFELSHSKGQAMLSTLQAALLAGRQISIVGGTNCTNVDGTQLETITSLTLQSN